MVRDAEECGELGYLELVAVEVLPREYEWARTSLGERRKSPRWLVGVRQSVRTASSFHQPHIAPRPMIGSGIEPTLEFRLGICRTTELEYDAHGWATPGALTISSSDRSGKRRQLDPHASAYVT